LAAAPTKLPVLTISRKVRAAAISILSGTLYRKKIAIKAQLYPFACCVVEAHSSPAHRAPDSSPLCPTGSRSKVMGFRNDYHGGRSYAADPAEGEAGFAAWLTSKLKGMFRSAAPPSEIKPPTVDQDHSPFSLLGASDQEPFPRNSGRPVFPVANWATRPGTSPRNRRSAVSSDVAAAKPAHQDL
jgi:hypothetical protein